MAAKVPVALGHWDGRERAGNCRKEDLQKTDLRSKLASLASDSGFSLDEVLGLRKALRCDRGQGGEERQRLPMTMRDFCKQPRSARRTAVRPRHVRFGPRRPSVCD